MKKNYKALKSWLSLFTEYVSKIWILRQFFTFTDQLSLNNQTNGKLVEKQSNNCLVIKFSVHKVYLSLSLSSFQY